MHVSSKNSRGRAREGRGLVGGAEGGRLSGNNRGKENADGPPPPPQHIQCSVCL